jgi:hypothetical protein
MTPRWLIAFVVVLALAFCGSALAGPKSPYWGDPDIFEGTRPKGRTPGEHISGDAGPILILFDVPIIHRFIQIRGEHERKLEPVPIRRIPVASSKTRISR